MKKINPENNQNHFQCLRDLEIFKIEQVFGVRKSRMPLFSVQRLIFTANNIHILRALQCDSY